MSLTMPDTYPETAVHPALAAHYERTREPAQPDEKTVAMLRAAAVYETIQHQRGVIRWLTWALIIAVLVIAVQSFLLATSHPPEPGAVVSNLQPNPPTSCEQASNPPPAPLNSASSAPSEGPGSSPPLQHGNGGLWQITCYGPPTFPESNRTARGCTIAAARVWAHDAGCQGVCAVGIGTPWYNRIRDEHPPILEIDGYGLYLAVDRIGHGSDVDIWVPWDLSEPGAVMWRESRKVEEANHERD